MSRFATILSVGEGWSNGQQVRAYFDTIASVRTAISAWDGRLVIRCLADEARDIKAAISGVFAFKWFSCATRLECIGVCHEVDPA